MHDLSMYFPKSQQIKKNSKFSKNVKIIKKKNLNFKILKKFQNDKIFKKF